MLAGSVALAGSAYMLFEAQWLRLRYSRLDLPLLPQPLKGLRLLHVSDLHAGAPGPNTRAIAKFVRAANEAAPDIVLFTGDMTDRKKDLRPHLQQLAGVEAPLGKFAVLGNHDHGLRKTLIEDTVERLTGLKIGTRHRVTADEVAETVTINRRLLAEAGIRLLENECAIVHCRGSKIQVCGIDEFQYGLSDLDAAIGQLDREIPLRILLSHSPDVVSLLADGDFQLLLSGHTHGGQICIPHPSRGRILLSSSGSLYADGFYQFPGLTLHVSRGVGTTLVPLRLLSRPEITLLELQHTA